jgi:hypothetical protein
VLVRRNIDWGRLKEDAEGRPGEVALRFFESGQFEEDGLDIQNVIERTEGKR